MPAIMNRRISPWGRSKSSFLLNSRIILAVGLAVLLSSSANTQIATATKGALIAVPSPTAEAGYNTLTFDDEFDSLKTIDVNATKRQGYNWYTDLPFGGGRTLPPAYSISDGVLTVTSTSWTANWALSSFSLAATWDTHFNSGTSRRGCVSIPHSDLNRRDGPHSGLFPRATLRPTIKPTGPSLISSRLIRADMALTTVDLSALFTTGRRVPPSTIKTAITGNQDRESITASGMFMAACGSRAALHGTLMALL